MDSELKENIQCSDNSYLSEFFDAMRKQDDIRSQITSLKTKDVELNDKILSFEKKICEYVQEGIKFAYRRLNCDTSTLNILAKYDIITGIFRYFKYLSIDLYEDTTLKRFTRLKSNNKLCFEYGHDKFLLIPSELMSQSESYSLREFSDKIIELCKKTVDELQENLKALRFE